MCLVILKKEIIFNFFCFNFFPFFFYLNIIILFNYFLFFLNLYVKFMKKIIFNSDFFIIIFFMCVL